VDFLNFRFFDAAGNQLTMEQLDSMHIVTPAMEHVFATVTERIEKIWNEADSVAKPTLMRYN
jgi:hypothetical protein